MLRRRSRLQGLPVGRWLLLIEVFSFSYRYVFNKMSICAPRWGGHDDLFYANSLFGQFIPPEA